MSLQGRPATAWVWLDPRVVLAVHGEQLQAHGGPAGVRDRGALEAALMRPLQLWTYQERPQPDVAALAAAYAWGLARNHPFVDGNKRTAFVALELFLVLNGAQLRAPDADCVLTMLALAAGDLSEEALASWIRQHQGALA